MSGRIRTVLDRAAWREWGFDLAPEQIAQVEGFFEPWFEVYNRPGVAAFDSQEALFGIHRVMEDVVGAPRVGRESRGPVSALRAGYCIASVERAMGLRQGPDRALTELFDHMESDEGWPGPGPSLGRAILVGQRLGDLALDMAIARPEIAQSIPGFGLRDALFADLRHTLLTKVALTNVRRLDRDLGELLMRAGHAVGFAEESLRVQTPRQES
jgi:hypothetical protein